ncbi:MAG TPA: HAD family acid phosphatase [Vicinamibacterales bacterium]|nr:HAD family acid phosphatase [Vicinamibacterales bacterium]
MMLQRFLFLVCALSAGCHATQTAPVTTPAPPPARTAAALPDSISWVQRSAEYYAAVIQVYRLATQRVEQQAASRAAGTWAVILDADETILSNLQYQIERVGLGYSPESWAAWVRRREATPLPGAAVFLGRVHQLGGRIAIVTNRLESECPDTITVFKARALVFDAMLCRPDKAPSDKNPRFEAVAAGKTPAGNSPLDVVAFVGDNILDFPASSQKLRQAGEPAFGEFGVKFFLLPNPMYGSWQENR